MNRRPISGARHQPIEDVKFANQMTLADASNRRIARHLANIFSAECKQVNPRAAPRSRRRSFASRMPCSDHNYVKHARGLSESSGFRHEWVASLVPRNILIYQGKNGRTGIQISPRLC
jgi:hypothetical protein